MPQRAKRRSRNAKRTPAKLYSDFGTAERGQHGPMVAEAVPADAEDTKNRDRVRAIEIDDPLYMYRRNRVISVVQRDAGLILRELWNRTGRTPRVVAPYREMVSRGSAEGVQITSEAHHRRFVEAIRAVGPIGSDTIVSVVCLQEFIPRGHYEILRRGLDILTKRFGVS
ncbi:MAG: hypothetical protein OXR03_25150 [Rhodospirillaceae bacterium]|nr:hypothetical protein [Rhodospirillaceae bacterium]